MSDARKYSVAEIDALRHAYGNKYLWGSFSLRPQGGFSRSYKEEEKVSIVEQYVRIAMIAGITADELYASEKIV